MNQNNRSVVLALPIFTKSARAINNDQEIAPIDNLWNPTTPKSFLWRKRRGKGIADVFFYVSCAN